MSDDKDRAEFEMWFIGRYLASFGDRGREAMLRRTPGGNDYAELSASVAWAAWQAARSTSVNERMRMALEIVRDCDALWGTLVKLSEDDADQQDERREMVFRVVDEALAAAADQSCGKSDEDRHAGSAQVGDGPPELEMHRAAYQDIRAAGFESPEELLSAYKVLLGRKSGPYPLEPSSKALNSAVEAIANLSPEASARIIARVAYKAIRDEHCANYATPKAQPADERADAARVIEWATDPNRKPSHIAFTAGPERQAAYWIEWAWANRAQEGKS